MRALFVKQLKQGRPLLIFAGVMGVLLVAAYGAVGRFVLLYSGALEPEALAYAFGIAAAAIIPLFAVFASSGMFSGEAHAGTLPVLLGLPLSRLRIWAATALAALGLTAGSAVVLLIIARLALRSPILSVSLTAHMPDAVFFAVFVVSVGLLCSSLARSVTAAIACAVLLAGGFLAGASALVFYYGAPITGLPILDLALWCFVCAPALLLGSALAIARGELLTGFRKWLFAIPATAAALALTVVIVCALARATTGYRRSAVAAVGTAGSIEPGSRLLPLLTAGGGLTVSRARADLAHEEPRAIPVGRAAEQRSVGFHSYTRICGIALDLDTGKEALVERAPGTMLSDLTLSMDCSTDGRLVATLAKRQGLTWGSNDAAPPELRIYDTQTHRLLVSTDPSSTPFWSGGRVGLSWSPTGKYLAVVRGSYGGWSTRRTVMWIVGADGRPVGKAPIILDSACWSPVEDVLYGFDPEGALRRLSPDGATRQVIWSPAPGSRKADRWFDRESISPDGRWIVMRDVVEEIDTRGAARGRVDAIRLIDSRSGESEALWRAETSYPNRGRYLEDSSLAATLWSSDGRTLYALRHYRDRWARSEADLRHYRLMRWSPGEPALQPVGPDIVASYVRLLVPPGSDDALLFVRQQERSARDRYEYEPPPRTVSQALLRVTREGATKRLPAARWPGFPGSPASELGFDNRGRLIYLAEDESAAAAVPEERYRSVQALDLSTGEVDRIYP
jgi:ABC-type transport system involved in multi-copper enzyme maturation permease subunit